MTEPRGHGHCADGSAMHFFKVSEVEAVAKGEGEGERASDLERTGVPKIPNKMITGVSMEVIVTS